MRFLVACFGFVLASTACASAAPSSAQTSPRREDADARAASTPCVVPLAAFCQGRAALCERPYEAALAELRQNMKAGSFAVAEIETGTCGPYRYLASRGLGGSMAYYDETGALVGGSFMADAPQTWCGRDAYGGAFGLVPTCTRHPEQTSRPSVD